MNRIVVLALAACASLAACSTQQSYSAGQAWQRNQCDRLPDLRDRERCLESADVSYERYRREKDEARRQP